LRLVDALELAGREHRAIQAAPGDEDAVLSAGVEREGRDVLLLAERRIELAHRGGRRRTVVAARARAHAQRHAVEVEASVNLLVGEVEDPPRIGADREGGPRVEGLSAA